MALEWDTLNVRPETRELINKLNKRLTEKYEANISIADTVQKAAKALEKELDATTK